MLFAVIKVIYLILFLYTGGLADWCQIENGGCEQICNNKCGRETSCSCLPGYNLAYDGKTCIGFVLFYLPVINHDTVCY